MPEFRPKKSEVMEKIQFLLGFESYFFSKWAKNLEKMTENF